MSRASEIDIEKIDCSSPEFENALKLIKYTQQSVFLTGKAGTGKSTFLQYLTHTTKKTYVVLAPTGIAAVNAGGQTIHSFFKLPFKPMLPSDPEMQSSKRLRERMKYSKEMVKMLKKLELIIIDEVSMVRADTIDFIDHILRVYGGNYRAPFGGKQLLLVGDVFQLEPVITGDVRDVLVNHYKNGYFFFNARAFQDLSIVPIELTKVYRQSDPMFIGLLDRIRKAHPLANDIALLNSKVIPPDSLDIDLNDFTITIATRRDIVDHINETRLARINRPERVYLGKITGDFPDNSLPTDLRLSLKEEAQVVFVKNDLEHRWVNGTIGKIVEVNKESIVVSLENGTKHEVKPEIWENVRYEYDEEKYKVNEIVIGTFQQFPLKLAWALTIHKSQGLTFDRVIVDVGYGAFSGGQTYVALSRCRSLQGLRLRTTLNARDIFVNPQVVRFSEQFNNPKLISGALDNARADDCYNRAAQAYDKGHYGEAVRLFAEAVTARNELQRADVQRLITMKLSRNDDLLKEIAELKAQLEEAQKRFDKLASEYVEMAEDIRNEGWEIQPAIANYDKALSISPDYYLAWLGKGLALAQTGDIDGSIECLLRASKLDTKDYRALYEGGRIFTSEGDISQAMDMLLHALQRNKKVAAIHIALAEVYEKIGDDDNAEKHRLLADKLNKKRNQKK